KALLGSAHFLTLAKYSNLMGVNIDGNVSPNGPKMQARKDAIVEGFRKGVSGLVQANKIKIFKGTGIAKSANKVLVTDNSGTTEIETKNIILATGSQPVEIPVFPFDGKTIISSKETLSLANVPQSMVIIGGGVIGCEMACVYATVGTKVTIVEALASILPNEDPWVSQMLTREFKKLGIETLAGRKVMGVTVSGGMGKVSLDDGQTVDAEKVLVAVGRKASCDKETIDNLGLKTTRGSVIEVNKKMETNVKGVYAIGDVVGTTYLAHGAFAEAEVAAANATGGNETFGDYNLIPRAVYTFPEVASIGKNETKCEKEGIETVVGKAMFKSNGRSVAHNENAGEVRVIRNKADNKIVGITMVGAAVTEMLAAARALIGTTEKITDICFAHPTVSEVLKEAWEDAFGISLHVPPRP
ncbi:MAG TPA: FAD-dependent oxidoreductase, partial [Sedimentisphaerales bacterium]|nr:FAD-dependent oxidoreductase [Sedimentisphaerales bacterium]